MVTDMLSRSGAIAPDIQRLDNIYKLRRCAMWRSLVLWLFAAAISSVAVARASESQVRCVQYRHLGPLTARDVEARRALDLNATDLGVSFRRSAENGGEELVFLFGDTHPFSDAPLTGRWDEDSIARTPVSRPDRDAPPQMEWLKRADGKFLSLLVPHEDLRAMEVPLDGIEIGSGKNLRTLLFFNGGWNRQTQRHRFLLCAEAVDGKFSHLARKFRQTTDRFLNVSVSHDPRSADIVWIFGTGPYRRSPIYLAKVSASELDNFGKWSFRTRDGWAGDESKAVPVVTSQIGELSVRYVPAAEKWLMTYQRSRGTGKSQGVYLRTADQPTGPWCDEIPLLEPDAERGIGFGQFMHAATQDVGFSDGLAMPGRERDWGDPYGPYLVPEWCYREGDQLHVVHTLSTWNPYAVSLMDAVLAVPNAEAATTVAATMPATHPAMPSTTLMPDLALSTGGRELACEQHDGEVVYELPPDCASASTTWSVGDTHKWLTFKLTGDQATVRLTDENGNLLRQSTSTEAAALRIMWRIDEFVGRRVTLTVSHGVSVRDGDDGASLRITVPVLSAQP